MVAPLSPGPAPAAHDIELTTDIEWWSRPLSEREAAFAALRAERPIARMAFPGMPEMGIPATEYWAVTRHAELIEASRQPGLFCSGRGTNIADMPPDFVEFFGSMIGMDDPRHARLRRIVSRGFTPRKLASLKADVGGAAADIVDDIAEQGECDFVTEVAAKLPLRVIVDLMGIPRSEERFIFDRTNVILGFTDPEYVAEQDDALAVTEVDGEKLTSQELASFFILLVVAGNETTRNAIAHGLAALTDHPDQHRRWLDDVDGLTPTAVEEIVRWASPVMHFRRTVTEDRVRLGDHEFSEGDKVVLWYNSANRDEAVFDDPYRFDLGRTPNDHVGFG